MRLLLLFLVLAFITDNPLNAQQATQRQDGIYITYQDFLSNKPNITKPFKMVSDTSIDYEYHDTSYGRLSYIFLDGSKRVKDIWGLRDSGRVYVKLKSTGLIELENMGRYPFVIFEPKTHSGILLSPYLVGAAISTGLLVANLASKKVGIGNNVSGYFNEKGKCVVIESKYDMQRLLRPEKDLYDAFWDEKKKNLEVYRKYLLLLNKRYPVNP